MAPLGFTCGVPWGGNVSSRVKGLYVRELVYLHCLSLVPFGEAPGMGREEGAVEAGEAVTWPFLLMP